MRWSVDILSEWILTLWMETPSSTNLRAARTAFTSASNDEHHFPAGRAH